MPAYSFQERFIPMILDGSKCQTIRKRREKGYAKPGDTLYLYFAMRTKWCRKLREEKCTNARTIIITAEGNVLIFDRRLLYIPEKIGLLYTYPHQLLNEQQRDLMAWKDGFRPEGSSPYNPAGCFDIMLRWWKITHELPFIGDIIFWMPHNDGRIPQVVAGLMQDSAFKKLADAYKQFQKTFENVAKGVTKLSGVLNQVKEV